ncbi:hypothetical protein [Devosia sp.]|uniref:hypothetical protein n=1 Tax=Devosia sp. TaxID=1871048 RepID=UPI003264733F
MDRRAALNTVLIVLLAASLGLAAPARADDGDSDSESGSHGGDAGGGGDNEDSSDDGEDQSDADHHDDPRQAVAADQAISLRRMLDIFAGYGALSVIDVALVRRHNALQYRIKFIDPQGLVRQRYFDALNGTLVD